MRRLKKRRAYRGRLSPFEFGLMVLKRYARQHGHACPPATYRHREMAYNLGRWVQRQRYVYRQEGLSPERIGALQALPAWKWDARRTPRYSLDTMLPLLRRFVAQHRHARVPYDYRDAGMWLGGWVSRTRAVYRAGQLAASQRRTLESLPGWTWDPRESRFERGLAVLNTFVRREGHARVPDVHRERGYPLGEWIVTQRIFYRRGILRAERVRRLAAVPGWAWDAREGDFARGLRLLKRFARREGHARVPRGHREEGFALGEWVGNRRQEHDRGVLARRRAKALAAVPGWEWRPRTAMFDRGLASLRGYAARTGHARVPARHVERGFRLGAWVAKKREAYRRRHLPSGWARGLEALPGWTWRPPRRGASAAGSR